MYNELTAVDIKKMKEEINYRTNELRPKLSDDVKEARSLGDLSENAEMVAWTKAKSALRLYEKLGYSRSEEKVSEWFGGFGYVELIKNL